MEKLNELAELAHLCDSMKNSVDINAAYANFICRIEPKDILAIAKAYRALEQINAELRRQRAGLTKEANDFEAKLEDLAKQKPRYQIQKKPSYGRESVWIDVASREEAETNVLHGYRWRMVYDAPAPAADLADSVKLDAIRYRFLRERDFFGADDEPGLASWDELCDLNCNEFDAAVDARMNHPDSLYSATLRNIEEQTK